MARSQTDALIGTHQTVPRFDLGLPLAFQLGNSPPSPSRASSGASPTGCNCGNPFHPLPIGSDASDSINPADLNLPRPSVGRLDFPFGSPVPITPLPCSRFTHKCGAAPIHHSPCWLSGVGQSPSISTRYIGLYTPPHSPPLGSDNDTSPLSSCVTSHDFD